MLSQEETIELLSCAKNGDDKSKEKLLEGNSPLIKCIIRRFKNRGVEYDDLYQLACIGFLKAIKNFDLNYNVKFSTYAVPMICGEVKRFLRDDGMIKVSRSVKVLGGKISRFVEEYKKQHFKEPTIDEISKNFNVDSADVVFALDASKYHLSIYDKAEGDDKGLSLIDKLPSKDSSEEIIDKIVLRKIIEDLPIREKKIIIMRYYRDKTQSDVAKSLGVSQVQVSRLEKNAINNLKKYFN